MPTASRLLVIDAFAILYRAYFAFINRPLLTSEGRDTSAIFGFARSLLECIREVSPTHLAVAFDPHGKTFRHELYPDYKANRSASPESVLYGATKAKELLAALGVAVLEEKGFEADDLVGSLVEQFAKDDTTVYMFTPDKDYQQLLSANSIMLKPGRSGQSAERVTQEDLCAKYGISRPELFIDILALWGDSSDNIPGVPGVGEKTAARLVSTYGGIEWIMGNVGRLTPKLRESIGASRDQLALSRQLVTIARNAPVPTALSQYVPRGRDAHTLAQLFEELEFKAFGREIVEVFAQYFPQSESDAAPIESLLPAQSKSRSAQSVPHSYQLVESDAQFDEMMTRLRDARLIALDTETTGFSYFTNRVIGISFSITPFAAWYLPLPEGLTPERQAALHDLLSDAVRSIVGHNLKFDLLMLRALGLDLAGPLLDTMLMSYLLDPDGRHGLDIVAPRYLDYQPISFSELSNGAKEFDIMRVPLEQLCEYAAEDADVALQLYHVLWGKLEKQGLTSLYSDLEGPLVRVLADMEWSGVRLEAGRLESLRMTLDAEMRRLAERVQSEAGGAPINIDSPKQVGELLFDQLKIAEKPKKTRTGQYNTSEIELRKYAGEYAVVRDILAYREVKKLLSTYVDSLPTLVESTTERIHARFNQSVTATGRLSSSNPNLQNIPVRDSVGRQIREAFVSRFPDGVLLSADYSQIELRLLAHMSEDEHMVEAFRAGEDIHTATAAKIFSVSLGEVSRERREMAKRVNFGIVYGISAYGLSQQLSIPVGEAAAFMRDYFTIYPGVERYMQRTVDEARRNGYASTLWGRRRWLPDLNSQNAQVRGAAERNAINAPIQGTAADIIKRAMVEISREMQERKLRSLMVIQVHDELIFDVAPEEVEVLRALVEAGMVGAISLDVPLVVDVAMAESWGGL